MMQSGLAFTAAPNLEVSKPPSLRGANVGTAVEGPSSMMPATASTSIVLAAAAASVAAGKARRRTACAARGGQQAQYVGRFDGTEKTSATDQQEEALAAEGTRGRTASRWSILSERIEGLAKEMYMVVGSLDPYVRDHSTAEGPAMKAIREKMDSTDWAGLAESKQTMFSYGAEMSTDPVEAQFVKMMTYMKRPKRVLEVGMFTGYGSMSIAEALPSDGKVTSLDIDPFLKTWVEDVSKNFPEGAKHEIVVGPALDSLKVLDASVKYDLVFIDANKAEYKGYLECLLERELLADDAMILADNTLYVGYPYLSDTYDTQPARRGFGDAVREFNEWVRDHPKLEQVILPIRDGVSMIRLK
jgi:caffeoyl-CoA O-methyltransferase